MSLVQDNQFFNKPPINGLLASRKSFNVKHILLGPGKNPIEKMEKQCRSQMRKLWKHNDLVHCPKLGSWRRRSAGLLNEITRIQNICLKRSLSV